MIAYLAGKIILRRDKFIVLEVNNIGYKVFLSRQTVLKLPEKEENLKLFCFNNIKEDASDLYGFLNYGELEFFEILNEIRGVGPKAALEISSLGSLEKVKDRVLKQDEKIFAGIPGIGAKKAMTIILELTGKIKLLDGHKKDSDDLAESGLVQLGFSKQKAKEVLSEINPTIKGSEERIAAALKLLGK